MSRIKRKIAQWLWKLMKPQMISGFKRGDGVYLSKTRIGSTTTLVYPERLMVADNVFIGQYNFIEASHKITIEEGCQITNYVSITSHSSHNSIRLYGKEYNSIPNMIGYETGEIHIGKYTFVGPHSVIMPGSTIGKGSIVAAGSFVKGSFPAYSIIAGNPAVLVGDTREKDAVWLEKHPELKEFYNDWSQ